MNLFKKLKSIWRPFLLIALVTLPLLIIYCFRIVNSYSYDNDFGRDLVDIFAITKGDVTLLGPKLSFGGLHTGPYYYYLFAPVLLLFPGQPEALLYANAVLAWLALVLVGIVWHKLEKWSFSYTGLALYWIGLSSYFVFSARGPGNAFSYIGWLVLLVGIYPQIWKRSSWCLWGVYGLAWGVIVNFHLAVLFIAVPLLAALAGSVFINRKTFSRNSVWRPLSLVSGFMLSFAPLILFEVTHNFVMFRNTFIDQSYKAFTQNTNLINPLQTSDNPIINFWLFSTQAGSWVKPGLQILVIITIILLIFRWKKLSAMVKTLAVSFVLSLCLVAFAATSQLAFHYFFPFIVLGQISIMMLIFKEKFGVGPLIAAVVISIVMFPKMWFAPSGRPIHVFRETVNQIVSSDFQELLADNPFSVYVTRETTLAPIGSEYRYFLATQGLQSLEPSAYSQAQRLLWIAEQPLTDINDVTSWELEQFGPRVLLDQQTIDTRTVYLFGRQSVQ